jgi:hypothetical protein
MLKNLTRFFCSYYIGDKWLCIVDEVRGRTNFIERKREGERERERIPLLAMR